MKSFYFLLYLPAVIFFLLPVINVLYQSEANEEKRRHAAETKAVEAAAKQAEKDRAAEIKRAEREKALSEKKRPGRPRKNPPVELPENILTIQDAEVSAPVRAGNTPDRKLEKPAPLPTSCTLEQFAAWIK